MCGIYGIISCNIHDGEIADRLEKMGRLQRHRGPDDRKQRIFSITDGYLGLGFVRLSILDLETGMQPIVCPRDNSAIVCNGQIYNYIELKPEVSEELFQTKGDVEVALHLYRNLGIDFLHSLNGMYAGAIYDPVKARLFLFRDRFGIKPLYYTEWNDNFIFSSEIKPLFSGSSRPVLLNESGLATYFTYRYLPGEKTMFHGIKRLPPGSYLEYDLNNRLYHVNRYWEYKFNHINPGLSIEEAGDRFIELLNDAVRIRLRSDVEVGAFLSGGIDSSAVSSLAIRSRPQMNLFSISFKEEDYNELPQIHRFLKRNGDLFRNVRHYSRLCGIETLQQLPKIVESLEEPISLGTVLPTDQVCQMAASRVKVVLTGEGADEIFAGYRKFMIETAAHQYDEASPERQRELVDIFPELQAYMEIRDSNPAKRYIQSESLFGRDELIKLLGRDFSDDMFPADAMPALEGGEHPLNVAIAFETRARLPDYVILRLDRLSMRHSLEARTPFLDYRIAEFASGLPVSYKINLDEYREKYICSHAYKRHSILDSDTAFIKKLPFTIPLAEWLSVPSSLPDILQEILLGDIIRKQGILDSRRVKEYVKRISPEGMGPYTLVSEADRVFAIIIFTLWYEMFFGE